MKFTEPQKRWIAALRSNKFKQGTNVLARRGNPENTYCCLGVACEIFQTELKLDVKQELRNCISYNGVSDLLPDAVKDHLNMYSIGGSVIGASISNFKPLLKTNGKNYHSLTTINDQSGLSFPEIADLIEKNADLLFKPTE